MAFALHRRGADTLRAMAGNTRAGLVRVLRLASATFKAPPGPCQAARLPAPRHRLPAGPAVADRRFEAAAQDLWAVPRLVAERAAQPSAVVLDGRTIQFTPESG